MSRGNQEELLQTEEFLKRKRQKRVFQTDWGKTNTQNYDAYQRGCPLEEQQDDAAVGGLEVQFRGLPVNPSNVFPHSEGPTQEVLDASEPYTFTSRRKGCSHFKQTIFAFDY